MTFENNTIFQVSDNIVYRKGTDDNYTLLEIDGDSLFVLNEVSAFVWKIISTGASYIELLTKLREEYEPFENEQIAEVNSYLKELIAKKILIIS